MPALRLLPVLVIGAGSLFLVGSAEAAGVGTGCPAGFTIAPVSVLGEDFTGQVDNVNHDGLICIKLLKKSGVFVDNVTP